MAKFKMPMDIGVISDTHGSLDPKVFEIFEGVDHILHAGDVGTEDVADELESICPVSAVAGNVDGLLPSSRFPPLKLFKIEGRTILIAHEGMAAGIPVPPLLDPLRESGPDLVVFGHTHKPYFGQVNGCYFFNPGSAGPRRFRLPRTVGRLAVSPEGEISGRLLSLEGRAEDEMSFTLPGRNEPPALSGGGG